MAAADLFNMFRANTPTTPPANSGQPAPNADPSRAAITPDPNAQTPGNKPAEQQPNVQQPQEKSPLAEFTDLWKTEAPKEGQAAQTDWNDPNSILPKLNLDPKKIYESAQRIDYSKVMPREKVDAALKGDHQAFMDVINGVAQHAYANMTMTSARMAEAMLKSMAPKLFEALPSHIRKHVVNDAVDGSDPIFKNPAVAPVLEMVKGQMQLKYPNATAKEIADLAQRYVKEFAAAAGGKSQPNSSGTPSGKKGAQTDEDWSDFLTSSPMM